MSSSPAEIVDASPKHPPAYYMHMFFFGMASAVMAMSFLMRVVGSDLVYLPGIHIPLPESCSARILFGFDCPACGMTRAFISISHGQFANAWQFNPASFVVYAFVAAQLPWQIYQMRRIRSGKPGVDGFWIYVPSIVAALSLFGQWIFRLVL